MIKRYQNNNLKKIWSEKNKFQSWLLVELYAIEAYSKHNNKITQEDIKNLWKKCKINIAKIHELEKITKHDVIAFVRSLILNLDKEKKWIHYGLTSSDVVDTALGYRLKQANEIIKKNLHILQKTIYSLSKKHKYTLQIGRTHGIHAEITTFGYKLALWWDEMNRNIERFNHASQTVEIGKISGAVGNYANIPLDIQDYVCQKLEINSSLISSQTLQRDRHAHYLSTIAIIGNCLNKYATEIRNLQRTEINEVAESFVINQKGSSAMPHKKNPIASENISGLSRVLNGYCLSALENVALWHERDISHSSVERIILPDATSLIDYMLVRFNNVIKNLVIKKDNMLNNIKITNNHIFSQRIMLELINNQDFTRQEAYDLIQKMINESQKNKINFQDLLIKTNILTKETIKKLFDSKYYLQNIDNVFKRLKIK